MYVIHVYICTAKQTGMYVTHVYICTAKQKPLLLSDKPITGESETVLL
jgi:hypothetical protein